MRNRNYISAVLRFQGSLLVARASTAQRSGDRVLPLSLSPGQRRRPRGAGGVRVRAAVEEKFHQGRLAAAGRYTERRRPVLVVDRIDVRTVIQQKTRFSKFAGSGHVVKQREA